MWKKFLNTLLFFIFLSSVNCQNNKNMSKEITGFTYLVNLLKKPEYHDKYVFIDSYVASVMIRKGYDYADAHQLSFATDNYFLFENNAIDDHYKTTYFRCIFINNNSQIAHTIKRKIMLKKLNPDELKLDVSSIPEGINRLYNEKIVTSEQFFLKLMSNEEFNYVYFKKDESKNVVYDIAILNNTSSDIIYNSRGEKLYIDVPFCEAEFIYNEKNEFVDLKIIK